jgi:hypothetical protein
MKVIVKIILFVFLVLSVLVMYKYIKRKRESFINVPDITCIPTPYQNSALTSMILNQNTSNVDPSTFRSYEATLLRLNNTVNSYNSNPTCANYCGGVVNASGACICPETAPVPYLHTDNKIYCVTADLSANLASGTTLFNTGKSTFLCNANYYNVNGDTNCYYAPNKTLVQTAISNITSAIASLPSPNSTNTVGAYGYIAPFYITGQAAAPNGLTTITTVPNLSSVNAAVSNAGTATAFSYNQQTQTATYYSGTFKLGTIGSGNLIVGSKTI